MSPMLYVEDTKSLETNAPNHSSLKKDDFTNAVSELLGAKQVE